MCVFFLLELYTDDSPGLKVDPVVVMTLSVVFIISVVCLHGKFSDISLQFEREQKIHVSSIIHLLMWGYIVIAKISKRFYA